MKDKAELKKPKFPYTEDELDILFRQVPAGIAIVEGPTHIYTMANPLYKKMFLRKQKEIIGKTMAEIFPELVKPGVLAIFDQVYTSGKAFVATEFPADLDRLKNNKLEKAYFNFAAQPIKNSDNKVVSILIHVLEVTEQVNSRKQALESEKYYRSLIENTADVIALRNTKGDLIYTTPSVKRVLGYTPEEYMNYNKWDIIHPDDRAPLKEIYREANNNAGKPFRYQTRIRHKDGSWRWVEGVATDLSGDPIVKAIISNFRDITREKQAEEMLEQSEERLRNATDAADVGTWRTDLRINKTTRDASLNKMFGNKPEISVVDSAAYLEFIHPEDKKNVTAAIKKLFANKGNLDVEFRLLTPDGSTRWARDRGKIILDQNKKPLYATGALVDITRQKNLERQKDEFMGIASHELKTPVTSIKAYTQVLSARFRKAGDGASAELVNKMDGQLNKLTTLINDLLDVTKIEAGKLLFHEEYFDLNELINEIVEETQRTTETHSLIEKLAPTKKIWGDRDRIGQVLTNLLTNAVKYSPDSKSVYIKSKIKEKNVIVSVQDFGVGIPQHIQHRIFDRFFRVQGKKQQTYPGLGLGLYISSEIINRHRGKIWFESSRNSGSTFYFSLPLDKPNE